jgi:uncharacterized repeat protein (TIGR03803 family)
VASARNWPEGLIDIECRTASIVAVKKEDTIMTTPGQRQGWISGIWMRATSALVLVVVFVLVTIATQSAQAQTFTVLHTFEGGTKGDGAYPAYGSLTQDAAANIYGTTNLGGYSWGCAKSGCGTVFELRGTKVTILHKLSYPQEPLYSVTLGENGNLYGVATRGGAHGFGAVFQRIAGKWTTLYSFKTANISGWSGLIRDTAGNLYGASAGENWALYGLYLGGIYKIDPSGKETVLHRFTGPPNDGAFPFGNLLMDAAGNLYGTTQVGGSGTGCAGLIGGCGTIFKVDTTGKETVLYSFAGPPNDGVFPFAGVIMDAAGNLYGTTENGGTHSNSYCGSGCGTLFKLDTTGKETVLYNFAGITAGDGSDPRGELTLDTMGNLYGTTLEGGVFTACAAGSGGCGTIFKLDSNNNETILHSFTGGADGAIPDSGLIRDSAGNLYGTAQRGGDLTVCEGYLTAGCGVVFKLTP